MRRVFAAVPLLLLFASGCYTVLRHPRVENEAADSEPVALRNDCAACHSDWDMERFGYAFHPGWYPAYGAWLDWYWEPWWIDVVVTDPAHPRSGKRSMQGAGLSNDRGAAGVPPGIWIPPLAPSRPSTVVEVPAPAPSPRSSDPEPAAGANSPGPEKRRATEPKSGGGRAGAPAQNPKQGSSTPAPRPAEPAPEPREEKDAGAGSAAEKAAPAPSQGKGMPNDRQGPKP